MNDDLPPPLEWGHLAQAPVEYLGRAVASISVTGHVSRRRYDFAQNPRDRWAWVLMEDVEHFRELREYRVHEEHSIDPQRDAQRALERKIEELAREVAEARASKATDTQPLRRGGRPRVPDDVGATGWHLRNHCSWSWAAVAHYQGLLNGDRPAATAHVRVARWLKLHPEVMGEPSCELCITLGCPPPPE